MSRCGVFAVIGAPNSGKSTLVNALVGAKVSIVTQKVQTTRTRVRGVSVLGDAQLIFIDTPGIFAPRRRLDRAMVAAAWETVSGVDAVILVVDAEARLSGGGAARKADADTDAIVEELSKRNVRAILALNKIDRLPRPKLLGLIAEFNSEAAFAETFLMAAAKGEGVADLKRHLAGRAPNGPWLYPADQLSDISERLMAAEVTREKLYLRLHDELPYESTVETDDWSRMKNGDIRIEQTIYVSRESHRPIVIGKGGRTLKSIGEAARAEISELLGEKAHLFLNVKVREKWADEAARYRGMGLDIVD